MTRDFKLVQCIGVSSPLQSRQRTENSIGILSIDITDVSELSLKPETIIIIVVVIVIAIAIDVDSIVSLTAATSSSLVAARVRASAKVAADVGSAGWVAAGTIKQHKLQQHELQQHWLRHHRAQQH